MLPNYFGTKISINKKGYLLQLLIQGEARKLKQERQTSGFN